MKSKWTRIEQVAIIIGIVCIFIALLAGYAVSLKDTKPYVSTVKQTVYHSADGVRLKQNEFNFPANGYLDEDVDSYFVGAHSDLEKIKLDFSNVNMKKPGEYVVKGTAPNKKFGFKINVVKSNNPVLTAAKQEYTYVLSDHSTMKEIISIAGVKAKDYKGKDITSEVRGWPVHFTYQAGTKEVILKASDDYGNTGYLKITIHFK